MSWVLLLSFSLLHVWGHIASMFLLPAARLAEFFRYWITTQIEQPFICCQEAIIFDVTLKVFTHHLMCDGQVRIYFVQLEIATCNLLHPYRQRYKILRPLLSCFAWGSDSLNIQMCLKDLPIMPLTFVQRSEVVSATPNTWLSKASCPHYVGMFYKRSFF